MLNICVHSRQQIKQFFTTLSQLTIFARKREEFGLIFCFQSFDMLSDSRLSDMQFFCGLGEIKRFADFYKSKHTIIKHDKSPLQLLFVIVS